MTYQPAAEAQDAPTRPPKTEPAATQTAEKRASTCLTSLPLSSLANGVIALQTGCDIGFSWDVRAGALLVGYKKLMPYARGTLAVGYPSAHFTGYHSNTGQWLIRQSLRYASAPEKSLEQIKPAEARESIYIPAVQAWTQLLDSEIALEVEHKMDATFLGFTGSSLKLWNTLPPQWRTIGSLRETRNASAQGLQLNAIHKTDRWYLLLGLGRMSVSVDRVALGFFYPSFELAMLLGESR